MDDTCSQESHPDEDRDSEKKILKINTMSLMEKCLIKEGEWQGDCK